MPIYDKPTKVLMREWAEAALQPGQVFSKAEPVEWFAKNYPRIKRGTVEMHVEAMSTNNGRIRQHHASAREGSGHDLFFKISSGRFRLWDPSTDPAPVYEASDLNRAADDVDDDGEVEDALLGSRDPAALREFAYEKDLQNFVARNLGALESGLHLYEDEGVAGVEFPAGGRYIDVLAKASDGQLVVIELKVSKGYDRVLGQIARYIAWVKSNLDSPAGVRGMIIANRISDDLRLAASEMKNIEFLEYDIEFSIRRIERD